MAASAVFIKSRENFLSILQHDEQQPVRAIVLFLYQVTKHWLVFQMRDAPWVLRFGTCDL